MASPLSPKALDERLKHATKGGIANAQELVQRDRVKADIREKSIQSQILRLNNEFGVLDCPDGDTLAYIGPPPRTLSESQTWDNTYDRNHFSVPHRVHSGKFLGLDSRKFNDLFGPRSVRTERRFRKEGLLSRVSTKGIKYFVDLRPPTEDEEAVVLLTSLTCTKGILTWYTAGEKYGISPMLVAGQDDFSSIPVDFHLPIDLPKDKNASEGHKSTHSKKTSNADKEPLEVKAGGRDTPSEVGLRAAEEVEQDAGTENAIGTSPELSAAGVVASTSSSTKPTSPKVSITKPTPTTSKQTGKPIVIPPEYSALRHRSAIERLVQAIEHGNPKIDSAPKLWTFFAVAKYFDCASHERISGWITKWLLTYPNSNFIQSNPEVALRIGLGTQSENITKDAFSILAGEKSLMNVFGESVPAILSPLVHSVHGRKLELLDDDERNRIDHAAASLVRRIRQRFDGLVGGEMAWLRQSSCYMKVLSLVPHNEDEVDVINKLVEKVKQFVRGRIIWVLCRAYDDDFGDFEQALTTVRTFYPGTRETFRETYNILNERERIFTRFFWIALNREALDEGTINLWTERISNLGLPCAGLTHLSQEMLDRTMPNGERLCQIVSKKEVDALILQFNQIERSRRAAEMQMTIQTLSPDLLVCPVKHEIHSQLGQIATTAPQGSPSVWSYNSFKGIGSLDDTSPKREQPLTPTILLKEKRRKLSNAGADSGTVTVTSSGFESLPIRSRETNFFQRARELQSSDTVVQNIFSETVGRATSLAPSDDIATKPEASKGEIISQFKDPFVSFERNPFHGQKFEPNLLNLLSNGLYMEDATHRQHVANVSWGPSLLPDNHTYQASATSSEHGADPERIYQVRRTTTADHLSDTDDSTSGRVVTAADWSLQDDDIDWTEPVVMQQFSNHGNVESKQSQPNYLLYRDLFHDISIVLRRICDETMNPTHLFHGDNVLPTSLIDTLMCLTEDEWKYLPLWAGGNDDGTGGVFDEVDVPNLEAGGFRGGKRGMGAVQDSDMSGSDSEASFDDVGSDAISTVGKASKAATDGTQTVRSMSDTGSEEEGFMRQNELWDEIRNMKTDEAKPLTHGTGMDVDKGKARDEDLDNDFDDGIDEEDVDEADTIVGAGSMDGDNDNTMGTKKGVDFLDVKDGRDDEDDMEIIDVDDL